MPDLSKRMFWSTVAAGNALGALLVFVGSEFSVGVQILGYLLLLPGSVMAAILPLHKLWHPVLWHWCETDPVGLSNALYLPVAVLVNLGVWSGLRAYMLRRKASEKHLV